MVENTVGAGVPSSYVVKVDLCCYECPSAFSENNDDIAPLEQGLRVVQSGREVRSNQGINL